MRSCRALHSAFFTQAIPGRPDNRGSANRACGCGSRRAFDRLEVAAPGLKLDRLLPDISLIRRPDRRRTQQPGRLDARSFRHCACGRCEGAAANRQHQQRDHARCGRALSPLGSRVLDPAFLRAVGGGAGAFRAIFITLVVLNLVASFQAFGTLLAIGPMLLPAAAARCWTNKVWPMIVLATVFGMAAAVAGLLISYYANLPSGPAIVISAGVIYGMSLLVAGRTRLKPKSLRRQR